MSARKIILVLAVLLSIVPLLFPLGGGIEASPLAGLLGAVPADTVTVQRGDSVSVRIDPMVPDKFLFTDEIKGTSSFGSGLVIGGALTVVFHLLSELLFK